MPTTSTRRIPAPVALLIGIFFGVLFARLISWATDTTPIWRSSNIAAKSRQHITLPTLDQRRRVLDIISTLSPHYTKECTRSSHLQPLYTHQAHGRYAALVGHQSSSAKSWLYNLFAPDDQHPLNEHAHPRYPPSDHKYYFAINLYNSFDIIPTYLPLFLESPSVLGFQNVYVSIYENGSTDQTKALLRIFDALTKSVGLRVAIRTSMRTRGAFNHRIEYLAEIRNAAFGPLHDLRDSENEYFETIIFMNDVLPCVDDLLELIWQSRRNNAGITCATDYMYHDEISAPVDINGTALEKRASRRRGFQRHLPVQVQSCWNGIAILDSKPFYTPPQVRFRMARITEGECSASECSLICNDYWEAGYGRIMMVPRVKLAYDSKVFDIIHPSRRNLTAIRGYKRLGGLPDDPRTDPQDRSWFGPHDRLFTKEESEPLNFRPGPDYVWCWGWDGAGDLEGPDVDPIWERMPNRSSRPEAVLVRHDRSIPFL
ncbi:glycosyltransferase family 69 protein [Amanita rubescens]|nr:glycosyltransferase family 69 protein [Amanita rubescens]